MHFNILIAAMAVYVGFTSALPSCPSATCRVICPEQPRPDVIDDSSCANAYNNFESDIDDEARDDANSSPEDNRYKWLRKNTQDDTQDSTKRHPQEEVKFRIIGGQAEPIPACRDVDSDSESEEDALSVLQQRDQPCVFVPRILRHEKRDMNKNKDEDEDEDEDKEEHNDRDVFRATATMTTTATVTADLD